MTTTDTAAKSERPGCFALPRPWLVADIGGTNARFGWVDGGSATSVGHVCSFPAAEQGSLTDAVQRYLGDLRIKLGPAYQPPMAACFAVATALRGDTVSFTNNPGWTFSRRGTAAALGLQTLLVVNDFEALALSLPGLRAEQLRFWIGHEFASAPAQTLAVIGPGTGLGVAGIVPTPQGWVALPGEGGHASLSAADDFESELLRCVRREFAHVSAERLLSGIGLPVLYRGVAAVMGRSLGDPTSARQVLEQGLGGGDPVAARALDCFCALLGSFAGNVALTLGARGGVYIGGGIVPRLGDRFFASQFRQRFEAKGRFQPYLQAIPTALITDTLAALGGSAAALEQHRT